MRNFQKYRFFKTGSKMIAVSSYAGKTVRGIAKCGPNDTFDEKVGKDLASARCWVKIAQKRYNSMVKKHDEAIKALKMAQKRVEETADYLREANIEAAESLAYLETVENSVKGEQ